MLGNTKLLRSLMLQGHKCCKVANVARSQMLQVHKCCKVTNVTNSNY